MAGGDDQLEGGGVAVFDLREVQDYGPAAFKGIQNPRLQGHHARNVERPVEFDDPDAIFIVC